MHSDAPLEASHHFLCLLCSKQLCMKEVREVAIFHLADGSIRGIPQRLTWEKDPPTHIHTHKGEHELGRSSILISSPCCLCSLLRKRRGTGKQLNGLDKGVGLLLMLSPYCPVSAQEGWRDVHTICDHWGSCVVVGS